MIVKINPLGWRTLSSLLESELKSGVYETGAPTGIRVKYAKKPIVSFERHIGVRTCSISWYADIEDIYLTSCDNLKNKNLLTWQNIDNIHHVICHHVWDICHILCLDIESIYQTIRQGFDNFHRTTCQNVVDINSMAYHNIRIITVTTNLVSRKTAKI